MPFKKPTTTYEEARRASRNVRNRIQPNADIIKAHAASGVLNDSTSHPPTEPQVTTAPPDTTNPIMPEPNLQENSSNSPTIVTEQSILKQPPIASTFSKFQKIRTVRKIMLSLSVPFPAPGVSASFDAMASHHDGNTALKTLLKRAMPEYEDLLRANKITNVPDEYETSGDTTDTTRMMDIDLVNTARQHFDPFGVLSMRALAKKIACSALAAFFAKEMNH